MSNLLTYKDLQNACPKPFNFGQIKVYVDSPSSFFSSNVSDKIDTTKDSIFDSMKIVPSSRSISKIIRVIPYEWIINQKPYTDEWWSELISKDYTKIKHSDICDHGYSFIELTRILENLKGSNEQIIQAYFTVIKGKSRLIKEITRICSYPEVKFEGDHNVIVDYASSCEKITNKVYEFYFSNLWNKFFAKVVTNCENPSGCRIAMKRLYDIFGLGHVLNELKIIITDYMSSSSHQELCYRRKQFEILAYTYNIVCHIPPLYRPISMY